MPCLLFWLCAFFSLLLSFSLHSVLPSLLLLPQFSVCYLCIISSNENFRKRTPNTRLECNGNGVNRHHRMLCRCQMRVKWKQNWNLTPHSTHKHTHTTTASFWCGENRNESYDFASNLLSTHVVYLCWPKIAAIKPNFTTSAKSVIERTKPGLPLTPDKTVPIHCDS